MPSGEHEGTALKLTTGHELTDGHSHFPTGISNANEQISLEGNNQLKQALRSPIVIILVQLPLGRSAGSRS
jgi:hypothetical protein